ncbi:MAG TPA: bifunctional phosphopantothenoylcysteine decarboxylase/phosphopantothenate--cysteine ligase CoaBC [Armatimonadota bacterium]|nr:bifunctional phosphopantothenoylcysteine decarboxylase/phosphopantothenate--cysteine ligase CoaBC [Armatimonadota bacterium]
MDSTRLKGRRIVLGVSGSIAAYKACELASLLVKEEAEVYPVLTRGGARFVTPETFSALCGRPTVIDEFDQPDPHEMTHIALAERAEIVVLAPASANLIARAAAGMANDMLTLLLTVTRAPVLLAPAMNTLMWTHPIVAANLRRLQETGCEIVEPGSGRLACGTVGPGKLAEPVEILEAIRERLGRNDRRRRDLEGRRILITAGPTREPVDAVRYLSNRSSGKMGYAIAEAALERGAAVTLVSGPTRLTPPPGADFIAVQTAAEMLAAVQSAAENAEIVIGAAAVADFTVEGGAGSTTKIRRGAGPVTLNLQPTVDILEAIGRQKGRRFHVGFAAEAGDPVESGRSKLERKHLDLVVANDILAPDAGFDVDTNRVVFIAPHKEPERLPLLSKREVADRLLDRIVREEAHPRARPDAAGA